MAFTLISSDQTEVPAAVINAPRPQRVRNLPQRFRDYQMFPDNSLDTEGDLVHLALFADCEPINIEEALQSEVWLNAMKEELKAIEKNST